MRASKLVHEDRIARLNSDDPRSGADYVLYWMQSAGRAEHNPALEFAIQQANEQGLPLVVVFCLTPDFPEANLRHYTFLLEGLVETLDALRRRNALPLFRLGDPPEVVLELSSRARLVVMDKGYLRVLRTWYDKFLDGVECPVYQVEGEAVVPVELASTKQEYAARTIRPRIKKHLSEFLFELTTTLSLIHI